MWLQVSQIELFLSIALHTLKHTYVVFSLTPSTGNKKRHHEVKLLSIAITTPISERPANILSVAQIIFRDDTRFLSSPSLPITSAPD